MPNEPRFVFDTNVVVSALLLKYSVARQAFDQARKKENCLSRLQLLKS